MHKKLMLACMAIAAFAAFVVAPAASARPAITENGVTLVPPVSITAKNTGHTLFTGGFEVTCTSAHLVGNLTQNNGIVRGVIGKGGAVFTGTGTGGDCTSGSNSVGVTVNSELCLEASGNEDKVVTTGCAANPVTFTLVATNLFTCKYKAASVTGTHTTEPEDAEVTLSKAPAVKEEGGVFCPAEGFLDMTFILSTTDGTTLQIENIP